MLIYVFEEKEDFVTRLKIRSSKRVINICSQCRKNCCDNHSTRVCKDCWLKNKRKLEIENRRNLRNFDVEDQSESESDDLE